MVLAMRKNTLVKMCLGLLGVYAVFVFIHYVILDGANKITLRPAPILAGQIEQVLGQGSGRSLQKEGEDFSFSNQYFENGQWAVVAVNNLDKNSQGGYVVMKKSDSIYQVVYGPGTSLASTQLQAFPADVAAYLTTHIAIYNPIPGHTND